MRVWQHSSRGAWHLYGHSHGNLKDSQAALSMDVGVDTHQFMPWHFEEIKAVMEAKKRGISEFQGMGMGKEGTDEQL
jgi:calcineurin-like phosphoesterase family protein